MTAKKNETTPAESAKFTAPIKPFPLVSSKSDCPPSVDLTRYLIEEVSQPQVLQVHETRRTLHVLVCAGDGTASLESYEKDRPAEDHQFETMEGMVSYLRQVQPQDQRAIIFVGANYIKVDLDYKGELQDRLTVPLKRSPEYNALLALTRPIGRKHLWRELVTNLAGCVNDNLTIAVQTLKIKVKNEDDITINDLGVASGGASQFIEITYKNPSGEGDGKATIGKEWRFHLPVYECFQVETALDTRLELEPGKDEVFFTFHIRNHERRLAETRLRMVEHLKELTHGLNVTIHEGENKSMERR